jgi:hypothetical protein
MYAQAVRLWLTLVTEAAIPVFVIGLAGWDRG